MNNIIFIDKPKGLSSFDVIRELRQRLGVRKMGHAGTLDPMATGLLIVGIGKGTRRLKEFLGLPKTYRMAILLGKRTDTGDLEGRVIEERPTGMPEAERVTSALTGMIGELELPIPAYSAAKYKGRPRYQYARRGIAVPTKIRKTNIYRLELLDTRQTAYGPVLDVELEAEKGSYARAVAEEIGRRLGLLSTMAELRRIKIGDIDISQARLLGETADLKATALNEQVLPIEPAKS